MVPCWNGRREQILNCFKLLELLIKVHYHRNFDIKIQMNVLAHQCVPGFPTGLAIVACLEDQAQPECQQLEGLFSSCFPFCCEIHCPDSAPNSLNDAKIVCKCNIFFFPCRVALNIIYKYFTSPWMSEMLFSVFMTMSYIWVPSMVAWACRAWAPAQNKCSILLS